MKFRSEEFNSAIKELEYFFCENDGLFNPEYVGPHNEQWFEELVSCVVTNVPRNPFEDDDDFSITSHIYEGIEFCIIFGEDIIKNARPAPYVLEIVPKEEVQEEKERFCDSFLRGLIGTGVNFRSWLDLRCVEWKESPILNGDFKNIKFLRKKFVYESAN